MGPIRRLVLRFATSLRSNKAERDLSREISAHLQLLEEDFVAKGMSREDARYAAKRAFGGVEQAKELQRDARSFRWLAGWPMDLKLGARMMIKSPGLTVIAVFALALAIAAGAAYLEFVNDLIRPSLSSAGGERVVGIRLWDVEQRKTQTRTMHEFAVWRAESTTLEHVGAHRPLNLPLVTDDGRADAVRGVEISAEAFRLFPAMPLMGRTLTDADEQHGAPPVVIIGHDLWKSRFDSDPNIIGRTVQLGPAHYTVVGVMPAQFGFPLNHNLWTPLKVPTAGLRSGEGPAIRMFAGLKAGVTVEAAQAELSGMMTGHPRGMRADVRPYIESLLAAESSRASIQKALDSANLLFVMLLAICGANIATLVFARTATRESEITVRTALGASRGRISAQLFAEALVLSLVAALAGLALAGFLGRWLGMLFVQGTGQTLPFWWNGNLSLPTVLYALALAVFTAVIVGVIPALKATGAHLQGGLREAGAGGSTLKFGRMWTSVIVTQVAITVMFLSTLVSLGWSTFRGQTDRDVTFSRDRFWTAQLVDPGGAEAEECARRSVRWQGSCGPSLALSTSPTQQRCPGRRLDDSRSNSPRPMSHRVPSRTTMGCGRAARASA